MPPLKALVEAFPDRSVNSILSVVDDLGLLGEDDE